MSRIKVIRTDSKTAALLDHLNTTYKIHSVFNTSINFQSKKGRLLALICRSEGFGPLSILIAQDDLECLKSRLTGPGQQVKLLSFLDFSEADIACLTIKKDYRYLEKEKIGSNIKYCKQRLLLKADISSFSKSVLGIGNEYSALVHDGITAIETAVRLDDYGSAVSELRRFIGLGQGLTPSGDDFTVGFTAAVHLCMDYIKYEAAQIFESAAKLICSVEQRTTATSCNMLRSCAEGEFPEALLLLLEAVMTESNRKIGNCFDRLIRVGSTSGSDMVCGMVFCIESFLKYGKFLK